MNNSTSASASSSSSSSGADDYQNAFVRAGASIAPGVVAKHHPKAGGGFGVIATQKLRNKALVASVPASLFLTAPRARQLESLTKQHVPSGIAAICIHLVRQRLRWIEKKFKKKLNSNNDENTFACGFSLAHISLENLQKQQQQQNKNKNNNNNNDDAAEQQEEKRQEEEEEGDDDKDFFSSPFLDDWIRRLPSQYDNLIQFAPHLEVLRNFTTAVTCKTEQQAEEEEEQDDDDDDDENRSKVNLMEKWELASKDFQSSIQWLISNEIEEENDEESSSSSSNVPLIKSFMELGLPRRYAKKSAIEVARWRQMAQKHLSFLELPPFTSKAMEEHRKKFSFSAAAAAVSKFFTNEQLLIELFGWAYSSLMSRGFAFDEEIWLMQPWVDYFNYSPVDEYNVSASFNSKLNRYEFKTRKQIQPNTELTLHYGTYCDFELSLWYGFCLCSSSSSSSSLNQKNHHHQRECAYVFSPLADPNGEYSSSEFSNFVLELSDFAETEAEEEQENKNRKKINSNHNNGIVKSVLQRLSFSVSPESPRCSLLRMNKNNSNGSDHDEENENQDVSSSSPSCECNSELDALLSHFCSKSSSSFGASLFIDEQREDAEKIQLLQKFIKHELSQFSSSTASTSSSTSPLVEITRLDQSSGANFGRQVGVDSKQLLQGVLRLSSSS